MIDVIDKPPVSGGLPPLPPFLKPRRKPERRVVILPAISFITCQKLIKDFENNWQTVVYEYVDRITGESIFDPNVIVETAYSHSRQYRQWLETYELKEGIPPHVQFGGAIESGQPDPTFYPRWRDWASKYFF